MGGLRQEAVRRTAASSPISPATPTASPSPTSLSGLDEGGVTFKWKDYRIKGRDRLKTMTLDAAEFIRRFLLHVLPNGFHRIRHYGLFARFGLATSSASAKRLPRPRPHPSARTPRRTAKPKQLRLCAAAHVAAAG